jgi:hypothetical protein
MRETINIKQLIGTNLALSPEDGYKVWNKMWEYLLTGRDVRLDFTGINSLSHTFLYPIVNSLYKVLPEYYKITQLGVLNEFIRDTVKFHTTSEDNILIRRVFEITAEYYFDLSTGKRRENPEFDQLQRMLKSMEDIGKEDKDERE